MVFGEWWILVQHQQHPSRQNKQRWQVQYHNDNPCWQCVHLYWSRCCVVLIQKCSSAAHIGFVHVCEWERERELPIGPAEQMAIYAHIHRRPLWMQFDFEFSVDKLSTVQLEHAFHIHIYSLHYIYCVLSPCRGCTRILYTCRSCSNGITIALTLKIEIKKWLSVVGVFECRGAHFREQIQLREHWNITILLDHYNV